MLLSLVAALAVAGVDGAIERRTPHCVLRTTKEVECDGTLRDVIDAMNKWTAWRVVIEEARDSPDWDAQTVASFPLTNLPDTLNCQFLVHIFSVDNVTRTISIGRSRSPLAECPPTKKGWPECKRVDAPGALAFYCPDGGWLRAASYIEALNGLQGTWKYRFIGGDPPKAIMYGDPQTPLDEEALLKQLKGYFNVEIAGRSEVEATVFLRGPK